MKKMLQRIAQSCLEFDVSDRTVHCTQKSRQELCKFTSSSQDLSIIYLRVVNSHQFNQSDLDTRSWYHGMAASKECLQAPLHTPSSPDRSRLAPLVLDYTRLSRQKPNREPVRRLKEDKTPISFIALLFMSFVVILTDVPRLSLHFKEILWLLIIRLVVGVMLPSNV